MRKSIKFILLCLLTVIIFWFVWRSQDLTWKDVSESLLKANPFYITLAVLIICLGYLIRAFRWKVLLEPITESSLKELFATTTVGFTAVFFVGRAGEIVRPMWLPLRDKRVRPSSALVTIGLERVLDLAAVFCFFAVNMLWFNPPADQENYFHFIKLVGNLLLVGTFLGFLSLFVYHKYSSQIITWIEKITDRKFVPKRVRKIILSLLEQLAASLAILKSGREILSVVFWTVILWLSIAVPTWLVILAFNLPVTVSLSGAMIVMGAAAIGSLVPTPGGGAGGFHALTTKALVLLSIDRPDAFAVSIVMHLVYFAPALIFGFYYLFRGDISIKEFRSLLSSDNAVEEIEEGVTGVKNEKWKSEK